VLSESFPDEYDMARFLANGDTKSFNELAEEVSTLTSHLIGYGLIEKGVEGFYFKVEAVKRYLQSRHKYEQLVESNESRLAEISERRNALEAKLRTLIRRVLIQKAGKAKAPALVVGALAENRREKIKNASIDELFDAKSCPVYFLELMDIVAKEWTDFQNIFDMDKTRLIIALQDINTHRADAHSKKIEDQAFQQLRIHFSQLEEKLKDW
jgi:hypothetical protein